MTPDRRPHRSAFLPPFACRGFTAVWSWTGARTAVDYMLAARLSKREEKRREKRRNKQQVTSPRERGEEVADFHDALAYFNHFVCNVFTTALKKCSVFDAPKSTRRRTGGRIVNHLLCAPSPETFQALHKLLRTHIRTTPAYIRQCADKVSSRPKFASNQTRPLRRQRRLCEHPPGEQREQLAPEGEELMRKFECVNS